MWHSLQPEQTVMTTNTRPTRMQVLLRPEDEEHLERLSEQYRARYGVPLRRQDAVRLAPSSACRAPAGCWRGASALRC